MLVNENLIIKKDALPGVVGTDGDIKEYGKNQYLHKIVNDNFKNKITISATLEPSSTLPKGDIIRYAFYNVNDEVIYRDIFRMLYNIQARPKIVSKTIDIPTDTSYFQISYTHQPGVLVKAENGDEPTKYTPSPEDIEIPTFKLTWGGYSEVKSI